MPAGPTPKMVGPAATTKAVTPKPASSNPISRLGAYAHPPKNKGGKK
jgi:hypothetical protein